MNVQAQVGNRHSPRRCTGRRARVCCDSSLADRSTTASRHCSAVCFTIRSKCLTISSTRSKATSRKFGTQGDELDFSLLFDGLAAEREQKITIDVAYRFFSTARRKFIVIDAPGHEEYTANMATGASVADLALVLVTVDEGLTRQTKRHAVVLSMLGVRNIVLAVNKMDRVGWSEVIFRGMEAQFRDFAADLSFDAVASIPVAAKSGDNVTRRSDHLPWYDGPSLLDYLENVEPTPGRAAAVSHADPVGQPATRGFSRL